MKKDDALIKLIKDVYIPEFARRCSELGIEITSEGDLYNDIVSALQQSSTENNTVSLQLLHEKLKNIICENQGDTPPYEDFEHNNRKRTVELLRKHMEKWEDNFE